ncbi:MAG: putative 3-hydroxybutyryl-coa dehydrogenase oxidoreductase protein [Pseudomonadota bacterium]|jgi:3-hydroxybutyryl-CoA dehydrogenase
MKTLEAFVVGVVGTGAMGRGIAQLFAQSGHAVRLFDAAPGAADSAKAAVADALGRQVDKGKLARDAFDATMGRMMPVAALADLAGCDLVIEAIVENLDVKKRLFAELEAIAGPDAILATNTSSLSVTAIAAACTAPARVAGYHFFNPVPLMKVVEVIRGARTSEATAETLVALTRRTGHAPVVAQDTPGFLINHAGRGYGTEALKLVAEGVADVPTVDRVMREQVVFAGGGFRLGPFELLDLTGLDVSHPVMESIYRQFYDEPRFRPSALAAQRVAGGLLGRKTGEGFYRYEAGVQIAVPEDEPAAGMPCPRVWVAPSRAQGALRELVGALGGTVDDAPAPAADSLVVLAPLGHDATTAATDAGLPAERAVAIDTLFPFAAKACKRRVLMATPATDPALAQAARRLFSADGARTSLVRDSAGFVAQRVVAMVVAVSCEIAQQRIASPADIDLAVRLGLGYPAGPLSMGDALGAATVAAVLDGMHASTGDPRYRPSLWLRRRARLGRSLLHAD